MPTGKKRALNGQMTFVCDVDSMKFRSRSKTGRSPRSSRATVTFDFDIGTLLESPCRSCEMQRHLPGCATACELLFQIQTILADGVRSNFSPSHAEAYTLADSDPGVGR